MSKANYFFFNGHKYITFYKFNLLQLVNYFEYDSSLLVVEYNQLICDKINWNKILIQNNDRIEIISIVGGG